MKRLFKLSLIILLIPVIVYMLYNLFLFAFHGFNPRFSQIDRCLDLGGVWDYQKNKCTYGLLQF